MDVIEPIIAIPFFFLLGAVSGSFGNVLIDRLPKGKWPTGRSHCDHCRRPLEVFELVPILSWYFLLGRCRTCKKQIPARFTVIELLSAALFAAAIVFASFHIIYGILLALALWAMLLIAVIDFKTQLIPDVLTLTIALTGIGMMLLHGSVTVIPSLIGFGFFGLQWLLSKGQWVGSGDVFLAGALGFFLGTWEAMVTALMLSYIIGAIVAIALLTTGAIRRHAHISFGPFLVAGSVIAFFFGDSIVAALFSA